MKIADAAVIIGGIKAEIKSHVDSGKLTAAEAKAAFHAATATLWNPETLED